MNSWLLIAFSYLLGSVPFGLLIAKANGIDLRNVGSGNIGATNVLRGVGKLPALATLLFDSLKGTLAVGLAIWLGFSPAVQGAAGLSAVLGHNFSVFLGFKGGKGVATSLGVILLYAPIAGMLTIAIWLATVYIRRYSSLGAVVSFTALPFTAYLTGYGIEKTIVCFLMSLLIIVRHSDNIQRLLKGTERRVGEKA